MIKEIFELVSSCLNVVMLNNSFVNITYIVIGLNLHNSAKNKSNANKILTNRIVNSLENIKGVKNV